MTVIDRDAVVLQLRSYTKSEAEVLTDSSEETQVVDLLEVIKQIKVNKFSSKLKSKTKTLKFGSGSVVINMKLPTLRVDNSVNEKFRDKVVPKIQKGKKHLEREAEKILSQVYFLEICKYIESITVVKKGEQTKVDFTDLDSFDNNFRLLEQLPTKVISEVSTYMNSIREYKEKAFSYKNLDNKDVPLNIDAALFAGI